MKRRLLPRFRYRFQSAPIAVVAVFCLQLSNCKSSETPVQPSIEFTRVPRAAEGNPDTIEAIEGLVRGAQPGQRIVLNASAGATVQIRCGSVHLFDGHVGRRKNRVAVKLDTNMKRVAASGADR